MVKVCRDASSYQNGSIISFQFPTSTFAKANILGGLRIPMCKPVFSRNLTIFPTLQLSFFDVFFPGGDADRWHWPADCRRRLSYRMHLGRRSASVSVVPWTSLIHPSGQTWATQPPLLPRRMAGFNAPRLSWQGQAALKFLFEDFRPDVAPWTATG